MSKREIACAGTKNSSDNSNNEKCKRKEATRILLMLAGLNSIQDEDVDDDSQKDIHIEGQGI